MRVLHVDTYYTSMEHLLKVFDRDARKLGFAAKNPQQYEEWKSKVRLKLTEITGIEKMERCELSAVIMESEQLDGYRRDRILIQTEPDVWMPVYALIPDGIAQGEKRACMLSPHGHLGGGKLTPAGRSDILSVKEKIDAFNYDYGVKFVKEGYITFCPDARAFGERREWTKQTDDEDHFLTSTCIQLNHMAICLGQSVTGMWVWDLMRLIDYIETRDDCDRERLGCAGLSGGGLQTLWLSAMDDRVKCAVVSGYFYGYKEALLKLSGNCGCNYVPHLWENVDMGDLGALIAPRPLLIESGSEDELNGERGLDNVIEQVEITSGAYSLHRAADKLTHHIFKGGHRWDGEKTYAFVNKWLQKDR